MLSEQHKAKGSDLNASYPVA